jgi:DMSO/TMAO reductase YedYZ molybdopterin-dependent catalytic subunit
MVAGVLAAAVALAVTDVVSALKAGPSLIDTIGTEFINRFAASLKQLAVSLFGTNDKAALVVGIIVVSLVIGGVLGRASVARPWVGPVGFAAFGVVGIATGITDPLADPWLMVAAAVLGTVAGIATLFLLLRAAAPVAAAGSRADTDPTVRAGSRRSFLGWGAGAVAVTTVGIAAGRALRGRYGPVTEGVALPAPVKTVPMPASQPFAVPGLSSYVTPNADFYRIDTALFVPRVSPDGWSVAVHGMVDHPFELSYDELLAMPMVEEPVTIACVSNEVGGDLIGNAVWRGVPLPTLLERAGVQPGATQIVGRSVDDFTVGFPTELALDGRTALVAVGMNGEPLPTKHGFPARLIVAGLYGYVSATKWLRDIVLTRLEDFDAYWVPRGWAKEAPIKTESRIDVPRGGASVAAGRVAVAGVAWAPTRGISGVEVQVDDGAWQRTRLGEVANDNTWVQWLYEWQASPGRHRLSVRATDGTGQVQTADSNPPAPDGATGYHSRMVTVA